MSFKAAINSGITRLSIVKSMLYRSWGPIRENFIAISFIFQIVIRFIEFIKVIRIEGRVNKSRYMKIQIIKEKHVLYDSLQSNRTHEQTCMISHLIAYLQGDVYVLITDKCFVAVNVKNFSTKSHNYYMVAVESLLGMIKASRQLNM